MKKILAVLVLVLAAALPAAAGAGSTTTIAGIVAASPEHTTLLALVKKAGLADELSAPGKLTLFAPTDAAFAKVPKATLAALGKDRAALKRVLLYHVVAGRVPASKVVMLKSAKTLTGPTVSIRVTGKTVRVNGARVTAADLAASNGIVHVIDRVLIPPKA